MPSVNLIAGRLARWLVDALRYGDDIDEPMADDLLCDLGANVTAEALVRLAGQVHRGPGPGHHVQLAGAALKQARWGPRSAWLAVSRWPAWRGRQGRLYRCSKHPETTEHILWLMAHWLAGCPVPEDIVTICYAHELRSDVAGQALPGLSLSDHVAAYREHLAAAGREVPSWPFTGRRPHCGHRPPSGDVA